MRKQLLSTLVAVLMALSILSGTAWAGYFGDTLTGGAKKFYQAMEKNPDVLRNEEYVITTFNVWAVTNEDLSKGLLAFRYDHPQMFWLNGGWARGQAGNQIRASISTNWRSGARSISGDEISINRAVQTIVAEARKFPTVEQQLRYAHDWLTKNNTYNLYAYRTENYYSIDATPWTAAGGLLPDLSPVCTGYACAFKVICDELGVDCILVNGTVSSGGHMWNYVRLGGNWYAVDVTWDDPIDMDTGVDGSGIDTYFLVGNSTLNRRGESFAVSHRPDGELNYPKLSDKSYHDSGVGPIYPVKSYTITLDAGYGDVVPSSLRVEYGKTYLDDLPIPTLPGYQFDGWYTSPDGGSQITPETVFDDTTNITLYAHWTLKSGNIYVTLNPCSGQLDSRTVVYFGKEYGELPIPTRSGYIFDGWYTSSSGGSKVTSSTIVNRTDNHTLYAHWTSIEPATPTTPDVSTTYTVTFDYNGGSFSTRTKTYEANATLGTLPIPTRNGYNFDGWYTSSSGGTKVTASTKVTSNQTLYAHWTKKVTTYTVTFDPNGGTVSTRTKTYKASSTLGTLPTPTRNGYNFDGWYTSSSGGTKVTASTKVTSNQTLYAHWTKKVTTYTVTFNPNGGTVSTRTKTYKASSTLGTLPTPTRSGYKFNGWYTSSSGGTKVTASTRVTSNRTFYAHWTKNVTSYTVTFNPNGGTVSTKTKTCKANATLGTLPTPTRSGYKFNGWYTSSNGGTKATASTRVTSNRTFYAHWTKTAVADDENTTYTVKFNANSGTVHLKHKSVIRGGRYRDLPTPTRSGYYFDGWYTSASGGTRVTSSSRLAKQADHTLYAHWTKSASVLSNVPGSWTVYIPACYKLPLYASASTATQSGVNAARTSEYGIKCTKMAVLSNGTVRYYGNVGGQSKWFQFTCEMDVD